MEHKVRQFHVREDFVYSKCRCDRLPEGPGSLGGGFQDAHSHCAARRINHATHVLHKHLVPNSPSHKSKGSAVIHNTHVDQWRSTTTRSTERSMSTA